MATQQSQDAAAKQRIIPHMNADHQDSVWNRFPIYRREQVHGGD